LSEKCRRLTHFDVDTFVEEVLLKDGEWLLGTPKTLKGFMFLYLVIDPGIAVVEFVDLPLSVDSKT
jgi:hypothetical protein